MVLDLDVPTDHTPFCFAKWDVGSEIRFKLPTLIRVVDLFTFYRGGNQNKKGECGLVALSSVILVL